MAYETILYETDGPLAVVTINRPKALNAMSPQVVAELGQVFDEIEDDDAIHVAIITGAGRAFMAGADITVMKDFTPLQGRKFARNGQALGDKLELMSKPVIAAVNGFALGGGCELAMACDFILAAESAKFGQPEINLGIVPGFGGTQRLPRLVGKGWAKYLCMTGDIISAKEAAAINLVTRIYPDDELMDAAKKMALAVASKGRVSLRAVKQLIDDGLDMPLRKALNLEAEIFNTCFTSPDQKEGMTAFVEKRKPDLSGPLDE